MFERMVDSFVMDKTRVAHVLDSPSEIIFLVGEINAYLGVIGDQGVAENDHRKVVKIA